MTDLQNLVGMRFESLESIKDVLKRTFDANDPSVSEAEVDEDLEGDFILDCCLDNSTETDDYGDFELFYLKDRQGNYYITEVNEWG